MSITLSKTETNLLVAAAENGGTVTFPDGTKPSTRERIVGRFLRDGLMAAGENDSHRITRTGYEAVGLKPPRAKRVVKDAPAQDDGAAPKRGSKQAAVLELLGRGEGASLPELVVATGWLPHTTRAVLSRLRSAGQELLKAKRPDGVMAYRIAPAELAPARKPRRSKASEVAVEATA